MNPVEYSVAIMDPSPEKHRFFCLRGYMKSGTNWLGSLLSSHQQIDVLGELHWQPIVTALERNFRTQPIYQSDREFQLETRRQFERMVKQCLISKASNAIVIGERTPHTIEPFTLRSVPHISVIRDGRDVLVSRAFHLHNFPNVHRLFERIPEIGQDNLKFKTDPWYFHNNPERLLAYEEMVRESVIWWRNHLQKDRETAARYPKLKVRFVQYENLHQDVNKVRRELFEFLEVDPDLCTAIDGNLKPGFKDEQPSEFYRKGAVGDWRNYFTEDTKRWFKDEGGQELITQGYEDSLDW